MKRVNVLVEGQTEERFVKGLLMPYFLDRNLAIIPTILETKRSKAGNKFKGGVSNYAKFKRDLLRLVNGAGPDALVTTLVDYYGLSADFPGMDTRDGSARRRVSHVESQVAADIGGGRRLRIFFILHEFEALLFSSPSDIARAAGSRAAERDLVEIRRAFLGPEDINERPGQSPSHRILHLLPGYEKPLHGVNAAASIGLATIRAECPHFDQWMRDLEAFA